LVSVMAMKVGVASVIRKKSSSLCLFFPRLRTLIKPGRSEPGSQSSSVHSRSSKNKIPAGVF